MVSDQKKKLQKAPKRLKNNTTLLDGAQKVAQARDFEKKVVLDTHKWPELQLSKLTLWHGSLVIELLKILSFRTHKSSIFSGLITSSTMLQKFLKTSNTKMSLILVPDCVFKS